MDRLKVIAFNHKNIGVDEIGKFHLPESAWKESLEKIKDTLSIDEIMLLSTCNRIEFIIVSNGFANNSFVIKLLQEYRPGWSKEELMEATLNARVYEGEEALKHLFEVASSLDSLVVGEREIITQVRNAYEKCREHGLTGDMIRIVIRNTIETAKDIYTQTNIAQKPVSVVSLAYRKLKDLNINMNAKILIVGSGVTNTAMAKYLKKHGFKNFVVFNRTLANAQKLADDLNGKAYPLSELYTYQEGFDVIVTCTGSNEAIITPSVYGTLVGNDKAKKIVIDLAIPNDLSPEILENYEINLIAINNLQQVAKENLRERESELDACRVIINDHVQSFHQALKTRKLELAMQDVPKKIKEIKETALTTVFAKEFDQLDQSSKEVLDKILSYVEKKYISMPMKMAREILIEENGKV